MCEDIKIYAAFAISLWKVPVILSTAVVEYSVLLEDPRVCLACFEQMFSDSDTYQCSGLLLATL